MRVGEVRVLHKTRKGEVAPFAQLLYASMKGKALSRSMRERAAKVCSVIRKRVNCRLCNKHVRESSWWVCAGSRTSTYVIDAVVGENK